jgi:hypothetical protein
LTWPDTGGETERESTGGPAGWFGSGAGHERFGLLGGRMRRTSGPAWFLRLCRFFGREERAKAKHSVAPTPSASQSHDPENRAGGRAAPARGRCSFPDSRLPRRLLWRSQWVGTLQAAGGGWGGIESWGNQRGRGEEIRSGGLATIRADLPSPFSSSSSSTEVWFASFCG